LFVVLEGVNEGRLVLRDCQQRDIRGVSAGYRVVRRHCYSDAEHAPVSISYLFGKRFLLAQIIEAEKLKSFLWRYLEA
jgi:hypothetical protein